MLYTKSKYSSILLNDYIKLFCYMKCFYNFFPNFKMKKFIWCYLKNISCAPPGAQGHHVGDHCSWYSTSHSNLDSSLRPSLALSPFLSPPSHTHQGAGSRTVAQNHPWVSTCPLAVRGIPRLPHPFCTLFAIEWLHLAGVWAFQLHHITGSPRGNISGELTRWTGS